VEIIYSDQAREDIAFWKESGNAKVIARITALIESIEDHPFLGIGKPERLKHQLAGCWSRRITKEHRIVYRIKGNEIQIISMRFHYM
jgi:toxin YoeB